VGRAIWDNFTFVGCFRNLEILHGRPFVAAVSLETMHDHNEPVLLIALKIMRHAKLYLSVIMFLICTSLSPWLAL